MVSSTTGQRYSEDESNAVWLAVVVENKDNVARRWKDETDEENRRKEKEPNWKGHQCTSHHNVILNHITASRAIGFARHVRMVTILRTLPYLSLQKNFNPKQINNVTRLTQKNGAAAIDHLKSTTRTMTFVPDFFHSWWSCYRWVNASLFKCLEEAIHVADLRFN